MWRHSTKCSVYFCVITIQMYDVIFDVKRFLNYLLICFMSKIFSFGIANYDFIIFSRKDNDDRQMIHFIRPFSSERCIMVLYEKRNKQKSIYASLYTLRAGSLACKLVSFRNEFKKPTSASASDPDAWGGRWENSKGRTTFSSKSAFE